MKEYVVARLLACLALAVVAPFAAAQIAFAESTAGPITEYALPPVVGDRQGATEPFGISPGADGAVWFSHGDAIGRITMGGAVREYPIPTQGSGTGWLHLGPDRAIWFAERNAGKIGRITVNGKVTEFAIPSGPDSVPQGITTGPDGALWFTEQGSNMIGRLTLDGHFTEFAVPTADSTPLSITTGPDGALWFVERTAEQIGRLGLDGHFTEYRISPGTFPQRITVGSDGALWFAELRANKIGRITTSGQYSEYPAPGGPVGVITGPDGAIWFDAYTGNAIGRMTTDGSVTEYPIPTPNSGALQITVGPDAALWFTETKVNQVGRMQIPGVHGRGQVLAPGGPGVTASFAVSFTSAAPGQGYVLFGPGPGCFGLVETATQDAHPWTTQHTVVVTGNDLPGTVGDVGIQPGVTYWYESVTVTRSGVEIDDNAGHCYKVTMPNS